MRLRGGLLPLVLLASSASVLAQSNPPLLAPPVMYSTVGYSSFSVTLADVNGDGKPDMVVTNACVQSTASCQNGIVNVLLGNGDGTFQSAVSYASGGYAPDSVVVADVNGDGNRDIVVANTMASVGEIEGRVGVLFGNGDGTFQTAVTYDSGGYEAVWIAVADVNNDGKPDLLTVNKVGVGVGVLLANGNGAFQTAVGYDSGGYMPTSVAVADVNGDGNADLLVAHWCASSADCNVGVLFGNGDGTFRTAVGYGSGGYAALSIAVQDLNGDGKPDIIVPSSCEYVSNCDQSTVNVLLGNGDGTFQTASTYDSGAYSAFSVAVSDINGDGKADIVVAHDTASGSNGYPTDFSGVIGVLLGNGDGTFQTAATYKSGAFLADSVAVSDLNGDGKADVVIAHGSGETRSVGVLINIAPFYRAFVQQPINSDGKSVFKANRGVIPVKFTLTQNNAPTCTLPAATISVTRTAGGVIGSVDEGSYAMAADNGSNFRIDQTACQYVYNLGTVLGVGTYEVHIRISGVSVGSAVFALK